MESLDLLQRVTEAFEKVNIDFVVVGGVAVIVEGEPRTTRDIDVIMENQPSKVSELLRSFEERNIKGVQEVSQKLKELGRVTFLDQCSSLTVDLKIATDRIDRLALSNKRMYTYKDLDIPIPTPELILLV